MMTEQVISQSKHVSPLPLIAPLEVNVLREGALASLAATSGC